MGLSAPLLAYGLGVILFAVALAALYGYSSYNSGGGQVRKNLVHREKMRQRKLARGR